MISELAYIGKGAKLGKNVTVEPFAYIADDVVIGDDCYIYAHATILDGTRMGNRNKVHQGAVLGSDPQDLKYKGDKSELIIGDDNDIRENVVIARATNAGHATRIGSNCHLMDGVHICHGAVLKDYVMVGLKVIIGGNCVIESFNVLSNAVILYENVAFLPLYGCHARCVFHAFPRPVKSVFRHVQFFPDLDIRHVHDRRTHS